MLVALNAVIPVTKAPRKVVFTHLEALGSIPQSSQREKKLKREVPILLKDSKKKYLVRAMVPPFTALNIVNTKVLSIS